MKKVYSLALGLFIVGGALAQAPSKPVNAIKKAANAVTKHKITDKTTGSYYIDYMEYDVNVAGAVDTYVRDFNSADTAFLNVISAITVFDTMIVTQDYNTYSNIDANNIQSVTIDTLFAVFHHQNNSGVNDSLMVYIHGLGAGNRIDFTNVLWGDTTVTTVGLTNPPSSTGYPIQVFNWEPNITINTNGGKFAMRIAYKGALQDTLMILTGYPTNNGNCVIDGESVPLPIVSEVYPVAYYQVSLGPDTIPGSGGALSPNDPIESTSIPTAGGDFVYYYPCNGFTPDPDPNIPIPPQYNPIQHWGMWTAVTITDNVGIEEMESKGMMLSQNMPNPANEYTNIHFTLPTAGDVTLIVNDIAGKQVAAHNLGNLDAGKNIFNMNTENLTSGVYFYTLTSNGISLTRKMVVSK